ncbi:MAG: DUF4298 domain-containing protein [Oscillospiraceae bacterium]|nr:DUF4298 domain-containing protein [Oscillospiraceae bacterium]
MKSTIDRIKNMEAVFDFLQKMVREKTVSVYKEDWFKIHLNNLLDYYENGQWLADYQLDEQGLLPENLKRGVLSEDGVYNFITDISEYIDK